MIEVDIAESKKVHDNIRRAREVNFIVGTPELGDRELFFGPLLPEDVFITLENGLMSHIMAAANIFPSASQARKNGWNKEIPKGFSEITAGKLKIKICILNLT